MNQQPRRRYTCTVCGGPAHRRMNAATRVGMEDADQPLLHLDMDDWIANPHEVVSDDGEPVVSLVKGGGR